MKVIKNITKSKKMCLLLGLSLLFIATEMEAASSPSLKTQAIPVGMKSTIKNTVSVKPIGLGFDPGQTMIEAQIKNAVENLKLNEFFVYQEGTAQGVPVSKDLLMMSGLLGARITEFPEEGKAIHLPYPIETIKNLFSLLELSRDPEREELEKTNQPLTLQNWKIYNRSERLIENKLKTLSFDKAVNVYNAYDKLSFLNKSIDDAFYAFFYSPLGKYNTQNIERTVRDIIDSQYSKLGQEGYLRTIQNCIDQIKEFINRYDNDEAVKIIRNDRTIQEVGAGRIGQVLASLDKTREYLNVLERLKNETIQEAKQEATKWFWQRKSFRG